MILHGRVITGLRSDFRVQRQRSLLKTNDDLSSTALFGCHNEGEEFSIEKDIEWHTAIRDRSRFLREAEESSVLGCEKSVVNKTAT